MTPDPGYSRLAGWAAIVAGVGGLVYSVAFIGGVVLKGAPDAGKAVSSAALIVGGLLTAVVVVALWDRARSISTPGALLGLGFAFFGALGAAVHGAYDLANVLNPPVSDIIGVNNLPNQVDPRGFLTFGTAGIGLFVLIWLLRAQGGLPKMIENLGLAVGVLLVLIYFGRLVILSPTNPVVAGLAGITGFVLSPLFYVSLGMWLRRSDSA